MADLYQGNIGRKSGCSSDTTTSGLHASAAALSTNHPAPAPGQSSCACLASAAASTVEPRMKGKAIAFVNGRCLPSAKEQPYSTQPISNAVAKLQWGLTLVPGAWCALGPDHLPLTCAAAWPPIPGWMSQGWGDRWTCCGPWSRQSWRSGCSVSAASSAAGAQTQTGKGLSVVPRQQRSLTRHDCAWYWSCMQR